MLAAITPRIRTGILLYLAAGRGRRRRLSYNTLPPTVEATANRHAADAFCRRATPGRAISPYRLMMRRFADK
jgi:hypothetical protein